MPVITIYVPDKIYAKLMEMDYKKPQKAAQEIIKGYFKDAE